MFQTEYEFTLPKGYVDEEGNLHRKGIMRLSTAADEILPLKDPRVLQNPAYLSVICLSRVISKIGNISGESITPEIIEKLFISDLDYLKKLYLNINGEGLFIDQIKCPKCGQIFKGDIESALDRIFKDPTNETVHINSVHYGGGQEIPQDYGGGQAIPQGLGTTGGRTGSVSPPKLSDFDELLLLSFYLQGKALKNTFSIFNETGMKFTNQMIDVQNKFLKISNIFLFSIDNNSNNIYNFEIIETPNGYINIGMMVDDFIALKEAIEVYANNIKNSTYFIEKLDYLINILNRYSNFPEMMKIVEALDDVCFYASLLEQIQ